MNPGIDQAAADWIARRYAGLSPEEEVELQRWLDANARHAAVYDELNRTWKLLDGVRETLPVGAKPDPDALAPRRRRPAIWLAPVLAAAAAVAIAYLGWPQVAPKLGIGGWRPAQRALHFSDDVGTAIGSFQKLELPDGSVVRLNTDSLVQVRYSEAERRVRLVRGEAHFTVTKNPARPFFVEAGSVAVRAVGTAFNVRVNREAIEVLVTEGKVRVDDTVLGGTVLAPRQPAAPPLLMAGERAVIPTPPTGAVPGASAPGPVPVTAVPPAEIERALAWQDHRLEFVAVPLADIVAEFNRYNHARLTIDDPALAQRRFGGSFRADDPENFVRLLETRFGLRVERRNGETILHGAP